MSSKEKTGFKLNISGGKEGVGKGKTRQIQLTPTSFPSLALKSAKNLTARCVGFPGYSFKITGGSDDAGIPMRKDVHGSVKKRIFIGHPPCYHPKRPGERRWKVIRGNVVADNMTQVNVVVTQYGKTKLFEETPEGTAGSKDDE